MPTPASENSGEFDLATLDTAIRDVSLGLKVADARVDRLLASAFVNHQRARQGLTEYLKSQGVEGAIRALSTNTARRIWYFGRSRDGLFAFRDRDTARKAFAELPDALRELETLKLKRDDLVNARRNTAVEQGRPASRVYKQTRVEGHNRGRSRGR